MSTLKSEAMNGNGLGAKLASVLPKDYHFGIYHLSTPPYKSDALYSAPPNERPDRTYCENHFLAVTVPASSLDSNRQPSEKDDRPKEALVLGIEIFIYTTAHSSTLFVSKADSTGYLQLLNLPKGTPSPIREITSAFVEFLVEERKRKGIQFVVSLFARAQGQYLFPGSVKHGGKHVLSDRGLVKWWCRVLGSMIEKRTAVEKEEMGTRTGYLVVPGLDVHETKALLPKAASSSPSLWVLGHPLEKISHYTRKFDRVPPRCLIPHFPDDPKSRFCDELDEEAAQSSAMKKSGNWKSVETLDLFWEMMAYRQECSSGCMTGFIWIVLENSGSAGSKQTADGDKVRAEGSEASAAVTVEAKKDIQHGATINGQKVETNKRKKSEKKKKKKKLRGLIKARPPRIKTEQKNRLLETPISTPYYYWPEQGRGENLVDQKAYKRCLELLLHLDFADLDKALSSSSRWIVDVGMGKSWGYSVVGKVATEVSSGEKPKGGAQGAVNNLTGLVKRKRGDSSQKEAIVTVPTEEAEGSLPTAKVNVLGMGVIRKKPKA